MARVALAVAAFACCAADSRVGCSPTPSCSLNDARFKPVPFDAGPVPCGPNERCRARTLAVGGMHSCGIAGAGELLCWGDDSSGQLGRSAAAPDAGRFASQHPVLDQVRAVATGGAHSCAIDAAGLLRCFGDDSHGQVSGAPASLDPSTNGSSVQLALGGAHSCLLSGGSVTCWGSAEFGQAGREVSTTPLPAGLVPVTGAIAIAAGFRHSCALLTNGHVACWGEIPDPDSGAPYVSAQPIEVPELDDAIAISAGAGHSCALRRGHSAVCWGQNESGELGDGTTQASGKPVSVIGLDTPIRIAAGGGMHDGALVGHTCAVDRGFYVWCWGRNAEGQLGSGEGDDATQPRAVLAPVDESDPGLGDIVDVGTGGFHSCALDMDGPVLCWGDNSKGQLDARDKPAFGRATRVQAFSRMR